MSRAVARSLPPAATAIVGLVGLASAMGVGRFAFTPLLPLMQQAGAITLGQGGSLARANYLGYLVGAVLCAVRPPSPGRAARLGLTAVAALTAGMAWPGPFAAWVALRFLAGVASAFVLVGVSSWALPMLAARGGAAWSGWVYSGVGIGIFACGLVGLATGVLGAAPRSAWLLLAAFSAIVAVACWRALAADPPVAIAARAAGVPARTWRLVVAYGAFGFGYIVPATFLPAAARQVVPDPAVFAWTWPVFGFAAAVSTAATSRWGRHLPPRTLWARAQLVMTVGVLAPVLRTSVSTLLVCAVCVGGTFMVATMAGIQEARRVAAAAAPRLIAAMTAAFAVGQLVGPFTVTSLGASSAADLAVPHAVAAVVLLLGVATLVLRPSPAPAPTSSLRPRRTNVTTSNERMPALTRDVMDDAQRAAADELIAGPRKGVKGPFIPLLRSPQLMARMQKVGEYLRFESALPRRVNEFATLVVSRSWTQGFEWCTHVPLAVACGTAAEVIEALRDGRRPPAMSPEEELAYDFATELERCRGVSDATYRAAVEMFGERGVVDLVALIGYFTTISMVLNVAHTPPEPGSGVEPPPSFPR